MKKSFILTSAASVALFAVAQTAFAFGGGHWYLHNGDDTSVSNENSGTVIVNASASANSGGNVSNGGDTGSAGHGGDVRNSDDNNTGGNGGNTGSAGDGGVITTGAARAETLVDTTLNHNDTRVNGGDDVYVSNSNRGHVGANAYSSASTGDNKTNGGDAGNGGNGGDVRNSDDDNTA